MTKHMSVAAMMMDQPDEERQRKFAEDLADRTKPIGKFMGEYGFEVSPATLTSARKTLRDMEDPYEALKAMYVPGKRNQKWGLKIESSSKSAEELLSELGDQERDRLLEKSSAEELQASMHIAKASIVKMRKLRWNQVQERVEREDPSYLEAKDQVTKKLNFMPYRKAFARLTFALDQRTPLSAARTALSFQELSAEDLACMRIEAKTVKPPFLVGRGDFYRYLSGLPSNAVLDIIDTALEWDPKELHRAMISHVSYGTIQNWRRMIRRGTPESTVFILHLGVLGSDAYDDDVDD